MRSSAGLIGAAMALALSLSGCGSPDRPLGRSATSTPTGAASPTAPSPPAPSASTGSPHAASPTAHPAPTSTGSASLAGVDLRAATYRTACFSNDGKVGSVRVHRGRATDRFGDVFTVTPTAAGDLTGDRVPEAAVVLSCTRATAGPDNVQVFTGTPNGPRLLGTPLDDRANESVQSVRISGGILIISATGYTATAPQCCPDVTVSSSYRWDGHRLIRSAFHTTPLAAGR